MKKLIFLFSVILFISCSKSESKYNHNFFALNPFESNQGNIESIKSSSFQVDIILGDTVESGEPVNVIETVYDNAGRTVRLINSSLYESNNNTNTREFTYNDKGVTASTISSINDSVIYTNELLYSNDSLLVYVNKDLVNDRIDTIKIIIDQIDKSKVTEFTTNTKGEHFFDAKGRIIKTIQYDKDNKVSIASKFLYTNNGLNDKVIFQINNEYDTLLYTYNKFDSNNNWIERLEINGMSKSLTLIHREIKYR